MIDEAFNLKSFHLFSWGQNEVKNLHSSGILLEHDSPNHRLFSLFLFFLFLRFSHFKCFFLFSKTLQMGKKRTHEIFLLYWHTVFISLLSHYWSANLLTPSACHAVLELKALRKKNFSSSFPIKPDVHITPI